MYQVNYRFVKYFFFILYQEISMDMCIHTCVRNKREGFIREGHKGRSQRSAYQQEDNGKGMVKLKHIVGD